MNKKKYETQRSDMLSKAKGWNVAADLQGERHYHQVLQEGGKLPDMGDDGMTFLPASYATYINKQYIQ